MDNYSHQKIKKNKAWWTTSRAFQTMEMGKRSLEHIKLYGIYLGSNYQSTENFAALCLSFLFFFVGNYVVSL